MNLLAFDTSTDLMSVAVQRDGAGAGAPPQVWQHSGPGGAQTSSQLIPTIQRLMAQAGLQFAELDAIAFGSGPGSFTGLRTACAVAQGLAFGANLSVLPIDTLLALAEEARFHEASHLAQWRVSALLDARMDELYGADYMFDSGHWKQIKGYRLIRPEELSLDSDCPLAGNVFASYGARLPTGLARIDALPTASALLRLAPFLLAHGGAVAPDQALPLYIRDKVAKTTLERAAEKAAL
ncbi:MAG: tRNA (adenosine(37)-N6)-threonylcarbamoyltransferase complex dimerization subunit type 1 TsaB [Gammaproteobacteria bacterium]|uniref:tRNA (adenosine(37)-N6)-threonylcarbamoyltransferase complex dimerization subunit type 1 TsaB n=1 Tax=Rhodoferax sp. TaxID=50421 RepID=UPI0017A9A93D|nr:tRNA (adenosine(37)-N6)-threonylcarbamoyltransferase complex dimerization subunit type 1 TsaB [Rhodoferax sp.]MBU3897461.1 tRNA (adenosine(37)-N6)-threonylcarbamoyltransferase complex dimerization subunit type 1 TsaB [Gammaproteobacteria bacterium]MBA3056918.1 tRNA (adenosine(37)-N6)-threonylcarbamoyltransferase complex dimerization subunit type 1 TsaB [Rhodoferax sp.]MBU3998508.1 tRNA (adenosine(37)-N6)-threonylcarbamoyltransferase complex dimerization subunit type 1 TsaB [Gammaproteobacteri